jgi:hypothetical protein
MRVIKREMVQDSGWFERVILPLINPDRITEAKRLKRQVSHFLQDSLVCITPNPN